MRYFVAVAEELHFSRAAKRLHITQPPLSQAIAGLEQELGVELFERTRRRVALTSVGEQWLPHARRVLAEAAALPSVAKRLARGEFGSLQLSFVSTADYNVLPGLLSRYKAKFPGVSVSLKESTSDLQIAELLREEIDAGIVIAPLQSSLHSSLSYRPLFREPLIAAVPAAGDLSRRSLGRASKRAAGTSGRGSVQLADVLAMPLILFPRHSAPAFHDLITGYLAARGVTHSLGQSAIQMQTILSLVSAGMGVALVPRSMRNLQRAGVRYLTLRGRPPSIETGLVWRREDRSPALARFLDIASAGSVIAGV